MTGITQLPVAGGSTALAFSSVQVSFSESLDGISARSPANYELLFAGADGLLDTQDDVELALTDGYTTGNGMGLGLSGARRLADDFELDTTPGVGTTVRISKWKLF